MNNKYYDRSNISESTFRYIIKCFALDLTVIFDNIRSKIANWCEESAPFSGTIEVDESYFGTRRIPGKRSRGASGKTIVFGIFKREVKVYTEIVPDALKKTLQRIIRGEINPERIIHTDAWRGYEGMVDVGFDKHFRVHHSHDEFANSVSHINGIESFWSFAKRRLSKFSGISKKKFYLHLKET